MANYRGFTKCYYRKPVTAVKPAPKRCSTVFNDKTDYKCSATVNCCKGYSLFHRGEGKAKCRPNAWLKARTGYSSCSAAKKPVKGGEDDLS